MILEYLDHRAGGGKIIPREPDARFAALRLQALADGMTDASLLVLYEGRFRPPERHEPKWLDYQNDKIRRGFAALEAEPPPIDPIPNVGQIALACLLGHRDLRFKGAWRAAIPSSSPGSTASPRRCRRSTKPRSRRSRRSQFAKMLSRRLRALPLGESEPGWRTACFKTRQCASTEMPSVRDVVHGPWRAVPVLGVTQIIAWGTIFYSPVLTVPLIAAERGWSLSFTMGGFSLGLLVAGLASPLVGRTRSTATAATW